MCNFSISFNEDASLFIKRVESAIEDAGGSFTGNTSTGSFSVPSPLGRIKGTYTMNSASPVHITVSKKPGLISCSEIETRLKKYINA